MPSSSAEMADDQRHQVEDRLQAAIQGIVEQTVGVGNVRANVTAEMDLRDLGEPFGVETTTENSATKAHEMYAVFFEAKDAALRINSNDLPGRVTDRQFFGRTMSTAFLALSEIWVRPGG